MSEIRHATLEDWPFVQEIAQERYADFHAPTAFDLFSNAVQNPGMLILRGEASFGVSVVVQEHWNARYKGHLLYLASSRRSKGFEGLRILRAMSIWALSLGAESYRFAEATGRDFAPLALRLGARTCRPAYMLEP